MLARVIPASPATWPISVLTALRTAWVISVAPPEFIIEYETRLIRSSPKRICGFITPADALTSPVIRSQRWQAMVVEPISKAAP